VQVLPLFDDMAYGCVTHPSNEDAAVAQHMQKSVQTWEGLLTATSGALVPENGFWYLINFEWWAGKWYYKSSSQQPAILQV